VATISPIPFIEPDDLMADIAPEAYRAIYDDDKTGDFAIIHQSKGVQNTLRYAHIWVVSALPVIYSTIPDGEDKNISVLLQSAESQYAQYLAWNRKPKYTRDNGRTRDRDRALDLANAIMSKIQADLLRIVPQDNPPEPKPSNSGGLITTFGKPQMMPSANGMSNSGDF
jgi:hypothetical protein